MELCYSCTTVVGYTGRTDETVCVKLPLKYPTNSNVAPTPNDEFNKTIAVAGTVVPVNSIVDNFAWSVASDLKSITLSPVVTNNNNLDLKFRNFQFQFPNQIISHKCLSVRYIKPETNGDMDVDGESLENDQGIIVIDVIDSNYLFVTLTVVPSDFIVTSNNAFDLDQFHSWGHISVPYSFELRSVPFSLVGLDSYNLIVSLNDGGLLHFKRSTILNDFDVYNFSDSSNFLPLNLLGSLFGKHHTQSSVVEGISSNSIIDAIAISEEIVITLTVSKQLKVWSLISHQLMSSPLHLSELVDGSWLTSAPAKHLQVLENKRTDKKFLTLFYTSPSKEDKSAFQIGAWEIVNRNNNIELDKISSDHHLDLPTMFFHSTEKSFQNSNWFIQDFQSEVFDDFFLYHILWKSNTSSVLVTYQSNISGELEVLYSSFVGPFQNLEELSPNHESDFYKHMIFNSGRYNNLITNTSLNIFKSHYGIDRGMDTNTSIRESMQEAIFKSGNDAKLMWFKLYSLCEEYKKLSEEVLGLSQVNGGSCLTTQVNGFGIFRPSHYYEKVFFPRSVESPESKLAQILVKISTSVSIKTCHKLVAKATSVTKLSLEGATELYNIYLKSRFSDSGIQAIIGEISSIPDAYKILNSLVQPLKSETSEIAHSYKYSQSDDISRLNKLFTIGGIRDIKEQHEGLLATLLVLFLLFEVTEDNVNYMNEIIKKLNNYNVFSLILDTSFKSLSLNSHIQAENLNNQEFSVFWSAIVNKHPQLNQLIRENKINDAFNYIYGEILSNDGGFIVDVIVDLINRGEGKFIRESFFTKLNESHPIDRFLMGLVYLINEEPQEFFKVFENYESFNLQTDQTLADKFKDSLSVNPHIKNFLDSIFDNEHNELVKKSNYYNALSELAKSQIGSHHRQNHNINANSQKMLIFGNANLSEIETNYLTIALHFQQVAIELLKQTQDQSLSDKIDSYYLNVFDLSLRLTKYDSVYDALSNLSSTKESTLYNYRELFMRFIKNLINNQSISMIFPPNTNVLYLKNYLLIDDILLTLATNDNNLSRSRKLYEYLYSWRLFGVSSKISSNQLADKRGAIEALYMFICRFRVGTANLLESGTNGIVIDDVKQFKLKILELYMIIINCLKSFDDDDDKWLIKHGESSNSITKLDDIKLEYLEWIKELEKDLHEL